MKIAALALILAGGMVQAGGALFATIAKHSSSGAPWGPLTYFLGLGAALLIAGLICRARTTA